MARNKSAGFTLIELMVVVTILGVISSIAVASYISYIERTQATMVADNFTRAVKSVRSRYLQAESLIAMRVDLATVIPEDAAAWIALINSNGKPAPTAAGAAYAEGAGDAALGSVGIIVAGDYTVGDSSVTITQPAFSNLPEVTIIVAQTDF